MVPVYPFPNTHKKDHYLSIVQVGSLSYTEEDPLEHLLSFGMYLYINPKMIDFDHIQPSWSNLEFLKLKGRQLQ